MFSDLPKILNPFIPDPKSKFMTTSCWSLLKFVNWPDAHSNSLKVIQNRYMKNFYLEQSFETLISLSLFGS